MILIDGVACGVIKCCKAAPYISSQWLEVYYDTPYNRGLVVGCISIPTWGACRGGRFKTSGRNIEVVDTLTIKN